MARTKSQGEIKSHQQHLLMAPSEVEAIDNWMFKNRLKSRGEAIRRLCQIGLTYNENAERIESLGDEMFEKTKRLLELYVEGVENSHEGIDESFFLEMDALFERSLELRAEGRYLKLMRGKLSDDENESAATDADRLRGQYAEHRRKLFAKKTT
ncbi:hypothetical protein [Pelagibacterium sp.]|uniref:hypothetical protein n=1 Tax=Pelagibacterium sp. TaxID=1967288 RepID=UPI003BA97C25